MRAETLKGHLEGLLLAVLADGDAHGYGVMEALREGSAGLFNLPTGTVYPALHRLQRTGLISSRWENAGGRRRRIYTLTDAGRRALHAEQTGWTEFSTAVSRLMSGGQAWPTAT